MLFYLGFGKRIDEKGVGHLLKRLYEWIHIAVTWLKYGRYGVTLYPI